MVEKAECLFDLARVFWSASVQTVLMDSGVTPAELLQFHRHSHDAEAALDQPDWQCSPFELERSGRTVWIITDPQQQSTLLLLEEP